ncbi:MAG: hypothetical protein ACFCD0_12595 [Gemmataceae bacterium]
MMKKFVLAIAVLATVVVSQNRLAWAGGEKKNYYPMKEGNKWTYEVSLEKVTKKGKTTNKKVGETTFHIGKIEKEGDLELGKVEAKVKDALVGTEHLANTDEGLFRHKINGIEISNPVKLLQYPVKKDEEWEGEFEVTGMMGKYEVKVLSTKDKITVPAGKYKAVKIQLKVYATGETTETIYWFAPDVGMVKQRISISPRETLTLKLMKADLPK